MNNEFHDDDCEEEVGKNNNDDGDLQHEETISTLQFPIWKPTGQAPMKNISPSSATSLSWDVHRGSR